MPQYASIVIALVATLAQASTDGKCRALVLSGGSNNGAWEAGVIWGLTHYGEASDYTWDVVSGVSAGSINTCGICTWAPGTEVEMTEWLSGKYQDITTADIWVKRPGNPIDLIFKEPSFLDDDGAIATLKDIISDKGVIARNFAVSAVDVQTGEYIAMTHENTSFDNLAQSCMSSGSIPVIFPPQFIGEHVYMDGGTVWNMNLQSAVEQCLEVVDDIEDVIIDVVICDHYSQPSGDVHKNAAKNWMEANSIKNFYGGTNSLYAQAAAYPGIEARYYFQEQNSCPGAGGLSFDNSTTWCLQEAGRQDAKNMLGIGQDGIAKTLEEWQTDRDLRKEHPSFRSYLNKAYATFFE